MGKITQAELDRLVKKGATVTRKTSPAANSTSTPDLARHLREASERTEKLAAYLASTQRATSEQILQVNQQAQANLAALVDNLNRKATRSPKGFKVNRDKKGLISDVEILY